MTPQVILDRIEKDGSWILSYDICSEVIIPAMEEYGKQQYNQAIKDAAEYARMSCNGTNVPYGEHVCKSGSWTINKDTILKLAK